MDFSFDTGALWVAFLIILGAILAVSIVWRYRTRGCIDYKSLSGVFLCFAGGIESSIAQEYLSNGSIPNASVIVLCGFAVLLFVRGVIAQRKRDERISRTE